MCTEAITAVVAKANKVLLGSHAFTPKQRQAMHLLGESYGFSRDKIDADIETAETSPHLHDQMLGVLGVKSITALERVPA